MYLARSGYNQNLVIFKLISRTDILSIDCEVILMWLPQDLPSKIISQYSGNDLRSQCWPRAMSTYVVTRAKWVTTLRPAYNSWHFQTIISSLKMFESCLQYHWSLFLGVSMTISQHCTVNGLAPNGYLTLSWSNYYQVHWRIYASTGLSESCEDKMQGWF